MYSSRCGIKAENVFRQPALGDRWSSLALIGVPEGGGI